MSIVIAQERTSMKITININWQFHFHAYKDSKKTPIYTSLSFWKLQSAKLILMADI